MITVLVAYENMLQKVTLLHTISLKLTRSVS